MDIGKQKYSKMYNYRVILLPGWISFMVLLISCFHQTSAISCNNNFYKTPTIAPITDVGNFVVHQNFQTILQKNRLRDVYIYYQELDEKKICWYGFIYYATCTSSVNNKYNNKIIVEETYSYLNYIKLENLAINIEYKCKIYAGNREGKSKKYSNITIPKEVDRIPKRLALTKIEFEKEDHFELSWNGPKLNSQTLSSDYIIYWCERNMDRHFTGTHECDGPLNWIHVPGSMNSYNMTLPSKGLNYIYAISYNSLFINSEYYQMIPYSTGMVWQSCRILPNKLADRVENIVIDAVSSYSVQMHWTYECSNRVTFQGYRILYCPVQEASVDVPCVGPLVEKYIRMHEINGNNTKFIRWETTFVVAVGGFQPMKMYMMIIAAITGSDAGLPSERLFITTEAKGKYKIFENGGPVLLLSYFPEVDRSHIINYFSSDIL